VGSQRYDGVVTPVNLNAGSFLGEHANVVAELVRAGSADALRAVIDLADRSDDDRAAVLDAIGAAARRVAPAADADTTTIRALTALATAADALAGFGVCPMGRPTFLSDDLLDLLREEAHAQHAADAADEVGSPRRTTRPAGEGLAHVAVSRQLREAVSDAARVPLAPTFDALYEYDPPGSHVRMHLDARGYDWTCHIIVEHCHGDVPVASVLCARRPDGTVEQHTLHTGDALLLRGRGTLHSWEPLGRDERRIMIAVGFRNADAPGPS